MGDFVSNFFKSAKKTVRHPKRIVKKAAPFLAAAVGNFLGGPLGGLALGALHGTTTRGSHHKLAGALSGAGKALAYSELASLGANAMDIPHDSFLGKLAGAHKGSLLHQTGLVEGARDIGGGSGLFGAYGQPGVISQAMENGIGWAPGLLGKIGSSAASAVGEALSGMASGQGQQNPEQQQQQDNEQYPEGYGQQQGSQYPSNNNYNRGYNGDLIKPDSEYFGTGDTYTGNYTFPSDLYKERNRELDKGKSIHERYKDHLFKPTEIKETKEEEMLRKKKELEKRRKNKRFAAGGLVKGNNNSGIADDIETLIPEGSYVANAMITSLLGDGSTNHGARKLREFEAPFLINNGHTGNDRRPVKAFISNDEYIISPATVNAIGRGSNDRGAQILKSGFNRLLKQKGVKHILPPAAKPLMSYMR